MFKTTRHLIEVNESYFTHFQHSFVLSCLMISGGIFGIIHSFIPCIFTESCSNKIIKIIELYINRSSFSKNYIAKRIMDSKGIKEVLITDK